MRYAAARKSPVKVINPYGAEVRKLYRRQVIYESGVERDFATAFEAMDEVKLFVKLPGWLAGSP